MRKINLYTIFGKSETCRLPTEDFTSRFLDDDNPQYLNNTIDDSIIDGYRIQVTSTNNLDFANSLSIKIKEKFNYETYIIFDSPNYKLRVGNFASRSNAENVRINLINHGYKKSWIIRTKIYKK